VWSGYSGRPHVGHRENVMSNKLKFAFVVTMVAAGLVSPALAHTARHNDAATQSSRSYNSGSLYNYAPAQGGQPSWPSAAALGNSH
jgi:hypothetical protein